MSGSFYLSACAPDFVRRAIEECDVTNFDSPKFTSLLKVLYTGADGEVRLVGIKDRGFERLAVVKSYEKSRLGEMRLRQVRNEIELQGQIDHPHIVQLWATWESERAVYMLTEYLEGGDLFEEIYVTPFKAAAAKGGEMKLVGEKRAAEVVYSILLALNYIHGKGLLHRDIKSENIFRMGNGFIKLGDFGFACQFDEELGLRPQTRLGTLAMMSPELLKDTGRIDPDKAGYGPEVDTWALGVVAYELLTGRVPFDGADYESLRRSQKKGLDIPTSVSRSATYFLKAALNPEGNKRPTAAELITHSWLAGTHALKTSEEIRSRVAPSSSTTPPPAPGPYGSRSRLGPSGSGRAAPSFDLPSVPMSKSVDFKTASSRVAMAAGGAALGRTASNLAGKNKSPLLSQSGAKADPCDTDRDRESNDDLDSPVGALVPSLFRSQGLTSFQGGSNRALAAGASVRFAKGVSGAGNASATSGDPGAAGAALYRSHSQGSALRKLPSGKSSAAVSGAKTEPALSSVSNNSTKVAPRLLPGHSQSRLGGAEAPTRSTLLRQYSNGYRATGGPSESGGRVTVPRPLPAYDDREDDRSPSSLMEASAEAAGRPPAAALLQKKPSSNKLLGVFKGLFQKDSGNRDHEESDPASAKPSEPINKRLPEPPAAPQKPSTFTRGATTSAMGGRALGHGLPSISQGPSASLSGGNSMRRTPFEPSSSVLAGGRTLRPLPSAAPDSAVPSSPLSTSYVAYSAVAGLAQVPVKGGAIGGAKTPRGARGTQD